MKVKFFSGTEQAKVEDEVNAWLAKVPGGTRVTTVETAIQAIATAAGGKTFLFISVWYVE